MVDPMLPRKVSCGDNRMPVPETDTGGWDEYSKALEITMVKELCILTP